jgi:hypothetical protein
MSEIEQNRIRQILAQGFCDAFLATLKANPDLVPTSPISAGYGEIRLNNYACAYSDNPMLNVLDVWFGRFRGRGGHPGEIQFEADTVSNLWLNHSNLQERFTNEQLAEFCVTRLRQIESG